MFALRSLWKPWSGETSKPPEKDEQLVIVESLMLELEHHCREIEKTNRERESSERRQKTGVDYSWLVSAKTKSYEIPQMERLDLEELCYQVKPAECGKVITQFRDSLLNDPDISDLPKILKACIRQVLDQRPKEESLTEWVSKRTASLTHFKIKPQTRIAPFSGDRYDVESQSSENDSIMTTETMTSPPPYMTTKSQTLPAYYKTSNPTHLPV